MATHTTKRSLEGVLRSLIHMRIHYLSARARELQAQARPAFVSCSNNCSRKFSTETIPAESRNVGHSIAEVVSSRKGEEFMDHVPADGASLATRKKPLNGYLNKVRAKEKENFSADRDLRSSDEDCRCATDVRCLLLILPFKSHISSWGLLAILGCT